jgi:hypothetical protein
MYWARRNLIRWDLIEPVKGQRNWDLLANLNQELIQASKSGARVILIVRGTPPWAQKAPASNCGPILSQEFAYFGEFMQELVNRYSRSPYGALYWEIGNEPDVISGQDNPYYGCWGDPADEFYGGEYYGDMLKVVYPMMKTANPNVQVMVGGLLLDCDPENPPLDLNTNKLKDCRPGNFLEGILRNGGGNFFDGVSFHAYDYYGGQAGKFSNANWNATWNTTGPVQHAKVDFLKRILARFNVTGKFLINTEVSLLCDVNCDASFETTKAVYLVKAYASGLADGLTASIWYAAYESWRGCGLLNVDGSPRPAGDAYRVARNSFGGARFTKDVSQGGIQAYEFQKNGRRVWVLWSIDGSSQTMPLPSAPAKAWNTFGSPLAAVTWVTVDTNPVYLEWNQ